MAIEKIETTGVRVPGATSRRLSVGAALLFYAGVIGIAYWFELAYRRWWAKNHPFAAPKASMRRMTTNYRRRRESVAEAAQFTGEIIGEVARAVEDYRSMTAPRSSRSDTGS